MTIQQGRRMTMGDGQSISSSSFKSMNDSKERTKSTTEDTLDLNDMDCLFDQIAVKDKLQ
jgi:hypothetical protein